MANEESKKRQTLGNFNITGYITVDDKTFELNKQSKNNANWIMNVFNPKVEDKEGKSMYMRFMDGYDKVKGKRIFAKTKDKSNIEISFADRGKEVLLEQLDDFSFVKVGLGKEKVKDEETGKEYEKWNFKKFITAYDTIALLKEALEIGKTYKVRLMGGQKFNLFNGNMNRNYDLQTIYILPEDDTSECEFGFKHNILLDSNSVNLEKWNDESIANIKAKVYQKKSKNEYEVLEVPFIIRANEENKSKYEKVIKKHLTVEDPNVIKRINIVGLYNCGYVSGKVEEADLPAEIQELIDDGVYTKEKILSMNAGKERVDELIIRKPHVKKDGNGILRVDKDDKEFEPKDLENLIVETEDKEIEIPDEKLDDNLLDELENL